jgi:hypothetical protein
LRTDKYEILANIFRLDERKAADIVANMAKITRQKLRDEVTYIFLEHPNWGRPRVYRELGDRFGGDVVGKFIKERAVGNWLKDLKGKPDNNLWQPWVTEIKNPARPSFLFQLQAVAKVILGRGLLEREAQWAAKLELDLDALDPIAQLCVVSEYAARQAISALENSLMETGDLDNLIVLKPWTYEGEKRYLRAFNLGLVPVPSIRMMMIPRESANAEHLYFSWRGCMKLGVPFEAMAETASGRSPTAFDFVNPPSEREEHLLTANWYDVLMEYWEWRNTQAASEDADEESSNE